MMKTEKDKVKRRVWDKPKMLILSVKETKSGNEANTAEVETYLPGS